MIVTKFYKGQGLGNQLWVYSVLRSIAWRSGFDFGIESFRNYKLPNCLPIDPGKVVFAIPHERPYGFRTIHTRRVDFEKQTFVKSSGIAISQWESEIQHIKDRTKIEGYFQSLEYINEFRNKFQNMFQVKFQENCELLTCYISVRGGDFRGNPEICCDANYYYHAISEMRLSGFNDFQIVTDDVEYAQQLLPGMKIASTLIQLNGSKNSKRFLERKVARDFAILQRAKGIILSNSTFAWWAAWTNLGHPFVIAPRYWSHPRNEARLWAPREIAVSGWEYSDGCRLISGFRAIEESSSQVIYGEVETITIQSKFDFKNRIKNLVYKNFQRITLKWKSIF